MTLLELTTGLLMLTSSVGTGSTSAQSTVPLVSVDRDTSSARFIDLSDRESVTAYVKSYFADVPALVNVARCESTFRQIGMDGDVLRGTANPQDIGIMQINEKYHGKRASELGFDLRTLDGNLAYAKYLYGKQGLQPWQSSSGCWKQAANDNVTHQS